MDHVHICGDPNDACDSNCMENASRTRFPTIVCLCGSTRFSDAFRAANLRETLAGKIVLSIGCDFKSDDALGLPYSDKERLDTLHLRKIDLADEVLILNVGGYIGGSTRRELDYAIDKGKFVRYLEQQSKPLPEKCCATCQNEDKRISAFCCQTCNRNWSLSDNWEGQSDHAAR